MRCTNEIIAMRVSGEELDKLKQTARVEAYATYNEFIMRQIQ